MKKVLKPGAWFFWTKEQLIEDVIY